MADTSHLIVTVHGIRTYGNWQAELKDLLEAAEPGVTVLRYQYGFFSSLAFLVPPLRWLVAWRFRNFLVQAVQSTPEAARIDLVAHSFGTYLAASALRHLPEGRKIHTVIFAGSVLRPSFPWFKYFQARTIRRVVNECGWDDSVLVLCQSVALLMGMAGRIGFHGMVSDQFINRYYRFGHGGYFDTERQLMRESWVPLLTRDSAVPQHDERPPLTTMGGIRLFLLSNMQFIKVAVACLVLMTAVLIPVDWYHKAQFQKRVERMNHIALLTNAQEIPGRDPTHVRDLLKVNAKASGSEQAIDHLIRTEGSEDMLAAEGADEEAGPQWWEWLPGMFDGAREGYRARLNHFRANQQLVAGRGDADGNKAKAQAYFERALTSYRRVNDYDPAHGSYALCLIDYGQLLENLGAHKEAIEQYRKVREDVFPRNALGQMPGRPPSLAVDSLIFEADSLQNLQRWDDASDRLDEAVRIAKEQNDNALRTDAHNFSAWLHMERLEVNQAVKDFEAGQDAGRDLVENGQFVFQIRLFHMRHGLAMADRLKGKTDAAYDQYEQIVTELRELMGNDLKFTPKQRRDLRDRLINSMERRADVRLFAPCTRLGLAAGDDLADSETRAEFRDESAAGSISRLEEDFQEAIKLVGNDDLETKVRLLYKKVIAQFFAELEQESPRLPSALRDRPKYRGTIDLEFAEAERTVETLPAGLRKGLKPYRQIAAACMDLRESVTPQSDRGIAADSSSKVWFAPRTVEKLRALTTEYAVESKQLKREHVEMLLLAFEILLRPEVEGDPKKLDADSTRMLAVLGETFQVASHPELTSYFERFQKITMAWRHSSGDRIAFDRRRSHSVVLVPTSLRTQDAATESLLFSLWFPSGLTLRITVGRTQPLLAETPVIDSPALTRSSIRNKTR